MVHKVQPTLYHRSQLDIGSKMRHALDLPPELIIRRQILQRNSFLKFFLVLVFLLRHVPGEHGQLHLLQFGRNPQNPHILHDVTRLQNLSWVLDELVPRNLAHVQQSIAFRSNIHIGTKIRQGDDGAVVRLFASDDIDELGPIGGVGGEGTHDAGLPLGFYHGLFVVHHHAALFVPGRFAFFLVLDGALLALAYDAGFDGWAEGGPSFVFGEGYFCRLGIAVGFFIGIIVIVGVVVVV
mmetsp:Transcript_3775/g.5675  ORF Transcript_3775/g.5675 Transcript_3775/m.5675 type:complete len:238 (-) Transcript_3775:223-936(-)